MSGVLTTNSTFYNYFRIATHRPGRSNENSMSSPDIDSSYLYRVSTRVSHISKELSMYLTPMACHTHVNYCRSMCVYHTHVNYCRSMCVYHTNIPMSLVNFNTFPEMSLQTPTVVHQWQLPTPDAQRPVQGNSWQWQWIEQKKYAWKRDLAWRKNVLASLPI